MISNNPSLVSSFLRASLKGWAVAVEEPSLVGPLVHIHNPKADPMAETLKMKATQALVNTGEDRIGWMTEERWNQMAATLQDQGLLPAKVNTGDIFTLQFLREVYGVTE
jgi:NitT/TauT family transport system substrate-binding protein